jgi:hypothetical protein
VKGLVAMDVWGLPQPVAPRLAKKYDDLFALGLEALRSFRHDVKSRQAVPPGRRLRMSDDEFGRFMDKLG